jgi:hypothetical protein
MIRINIKGLLEIFEESNQIHIVLLDSNILFWRSFCPLFAPVEQMTGYFRWTEGGGSRCGLIYGDIKKGPVLPVEG